MQFGVTDHVDASGTYAVATRASFLLMHGDRDGLISEEQGQVMQQALVGAGADSTLMLIAGANHEDPAFHGPASLGAVTGFFRERLWTSPEH
jgi:dipeptidyl aminopeptidase/acylaminoacyl peptidase